MSVERVYETFGLRERPFAVAPDPEFILWTPQHKRAFATLEYGLMARSPISLLTGEIGAGKTTLVRALLSSVGDRYTVGMVTETQGRTTTVVEWTLKALAIVPPASARPVDMVAVLQDFIMSEFEAGRRVILCYDEAQNLANDTLEALRILTNINIGGHEPLQLILVGQPQLRTTIRQPKFTQLAQRIAVTYHLRPLDQATVAAYIAHRLRIAGGTGEEFSEEACHLIYSVTEGIPRRINQLCDISMMYAWSAGHADVDVDTIENVLDDDVIFACEIGKEGSAT